MPEMDRLQAPEGNRAQHSQRPRGVLLLAPFERAGLLASRISATHPEAGATGLCGRRNHAPMLFCRRKISGTIRSDLASKEPEYSLWPIHLNIADDLLKQGMCTTVLDEILIDLDVLFESTRYFSIRYGLFSHAIACGSSEMIKPKLRRLAERTKS
jgi:hypothetical protein